MGTQAWSTSPGIPQSHQVLPAVVSNSGTIQLPHLLRGRSGSSRTPALRSLASSRRCLAYSEGRISPSSRSSHSMVACEALCPSWRGIAQIVRCSQAGLGASHVRPQDPVQPYELVGAAVSSAAQPVSFWLVTCARSRSGMSISRQNLAVDMPASTWITSGSSNGPTCSPPISSTPESQQQSHPTPESTRRPRPPTAPPGTWTYLPRSQLCHLQGTAVSNSRSPARKPSPSGLPQQSRSHRAARTTRSVTSSPHGSSQNDS